MMAYTETREEKPEFKPVTLSIQFNTQIELDMFATIFNLPLKELFNPVQSELIVTALKERGADCEKWIKYLMKGLHERTAA